MTARGVYWVKTAPEIADMSYLKLWLPFVEEMNKVSRDGEKD